MGAPLPLLGFPMIGGSFGTGGAAGVPAFGTRLIQPGAIAGGGLVTFSRAQTGGARSTAFAADGTTLVEYGADTPRFTGTVQRLLLGGQRTNFATNPRAEGAVAGTPGGSPSGWATESTGLTVNGIATISGIPLLDLSYTTSGVENRQNSLNAATVTATPGQFWTASCFVYIVSGTGVSARIEIEYRDSGGSILPGGTFSGSSVSTQGVLHAISITGTAPASTARITVQIRFNFTQATTMRAYYGLPQIEVGASASSQIFPAVGAPASSTRGQDNLTAGFSTLFPSGVGTVLGSFLMPYASTLTASQLFEIHDGTVNNRLLIWIPTDGGGVSVRASRVIGGTLASATDLGTHTPGTLFRAGLTFDGTTITANLNGGTNQTVAGQPSGLTTFRVGNNLLGSTPMFGEVGYFDTLPYVIPGANLPAAVSAIP